MKKRPDTSKPTTENFKQTLTNAAHEVDTWPVWKKEALGKTILTASESVTHKHNKSA